MASLYELRDVRLRKLDDLKKRGIDPYPARVKRTHSIEDAKLQAEKITSTDETITLAGRIRGLRAHGGSTFLDLQDGTDTIQIFCEETKLGHKYELVRDLVDLGDFMQATGTLFTTKQGAL